ncbi:MAG: GNAT family N-acetyltransferase [Acidiphilium sp. 37-64-53]|uniref:GNAT family N-acetyltransferase n=1 Tax=Acidiphilium TaxID=522 RepID=UPI000BDAEE9E|nr:MULTISPECIES: GNAT family N-acetyltransferase [Acidiphilium]MBW4036024.1 GNAT family N-acetyltransferase [Pseudomonadota bacterium]OYV63406.1 MAG: GNAT family N-acetyltransferase [Acidiphilium sp. 21-62-4]OYW02596.1 MAG: GNAT family N-acetyltransferase [Acidiphilium sp. 37-64-53]OZB29884.1 MAG: GNAT family N-acetyltransferase [Acidiphilium sp. 34-64-41]HQT84020.1 GNAT family N-acetyltransferase [Acidiphilium rubrum]
MLDYARARPGEAIDRVIVTVTFMRLDRKPPVVWHPLPAGAVIEPARRLDVSTYRALYDRVGQPWLWWLRRMMPDDMLAHLLADPAIAVHVLNYNGEPAGFFELDATYWPDINLSYFGLLPQAIGQGLGFSLLGAAIDRVFAGPVRGMTVNTCTADHPRALPNYRRAGFRITRQVNEVWDIPQRLGFTIPDHLRPGTT